MNAINFAVQGTVTLRDQSGHVIGSQTVSFPSHSSTPIGMTTILAQVGSQAHSGSVTIAQDPNVKGPALLAQLSMSMHTGSQGAFLEEEFGMPSAHGSSVLQGVASQTRNLPLVAVTSVSDAAQTIQATCVGENKAATSIELPARGTAVVQACSWQEVPDTSLNLASTLASSSENKQADHAISLRSDSVAGSFYAFGLALNGGLSLAQLQPLDFYDPGTSPSTGIVYVGVPTGPSSLLSAALSAPTITLANFSSQPRQTSITWSDSSSGTPKVQPLANVTLAPFSTQTTTLSSVRGTGILNTFTITSDGKPGDVQAHLFSTMGSSSQRAEQLAKDAQDDHNGGDHPWSTANGDQSTLLLYNSSTKPNPFFVRISGNGNTWEQTYTLAPKETRALSINDLMIKKEADHKKFLLPADLAQGEIQWATEFGGTGFGRLLVTNSSRSLARNFSCTTYYNLCAASFGPENFEDVLLGGGISVDLSQITPTFCTEYSPSACGQNTTVSSYQAYTTHWSNSTGVSQTYAANTDLQVKGVSLGQYTVTAYETAGYCQTAPTGGGGTVQVPTYFILQSHTHVATPAICTNNQAIGYFEDLSNYVADQSGNRISMSGITPLESTNGFNAYANPSSTRSDGSFDDTPFGACYGATGSFCAPGSGTITHKATQNGTTSSIYTSYSTIECTQGLKLTITGNPANTSQGFTDGTVYQP